MLHECVILLAWLDQEHSFHNSKAEGYTTISIMKTAQLVQIIYT